MTFPFMSEHAVNRVLIRHSRGGNGVVGLASWYCEIGDNDGHSSILFVSPLTSNILKDYKHRQDRDADVGKEVSRATSDAVPLGIST